MFNVIFRMFLVMFLFIMFDIGLIWIMEFNKVDWIIGRMFDINNDI